MAGFGEDLIFGNPEMAFAPQRVGINRPGYTRIPPPKPGVRSPAGYLKVAPPPVVFGPQAQDAENQWYADNAQSQANRIGAQKAAAQPNVGLQSVAPRVPFEQAELNLIGQQADAAKAAGSGINDWDRIAANNKGLSDLFGQYHGGMSRGEYMQSAQSPLGATVYRADPGTRDFTVNPVAAAMGGGDRMANQQQIVDAMLARGGTLANSPSFGNAVAANQEYQQNAQNAVQRGLGQSQAGALTSHAATAAGNLGLGREGLALERDKFNDPLRQKKSEAEIATMASEGEYRKALAATQQGELEHQRQLLPIQTMEAQGKAELAKAQAAGVPRELDLKAQEIAARTEQARIDAAGRNAPLEHPVMQATAFANANLPVPVGLKERVGLPVAPEERLQSLGLPSEGLIPALKQIEQSGMPITPEAEAALMAAHGPEIEARLKGRHPMSSMGENIETLNPFRPISTYTQMVQRMLGPNRKRVGIANKPVAPVGVPGAAPATAEYRGRPTGGGELPWYLNF